MKHLALTKLRPEQAERLDQWCEDRARHSTDGRRLWRCWHCDDLSPWTPAHGWYGSWKELDDDLPLIIFCGEACRTSLEIKEILPRLTPALSSTERSDG